MPTAIIGCLAIHTAAHCRAFDPIHSGIYMGGAGDFKLDAQRYLL
jgi:hypothetical protein